MKNIYEYWAEIEFAIPEGTVWYGAARLSNGNYYVAASSQWEVSVLRYDDRGSLDISFGEQGIVKFPNPDRFGTKFSFSLQENVVMLSCLAGEAGNYSNFLLCKLDADTGALDPGFGDNGVKVVPIPQANQADIVGLSVNQTPQLPDGKHRQLVSRGMAQFELTGELDPAFNENGVLRSFPKSSYEYQTMNIMSYMSAGKHEGFLMSGVFNLGGYGRGWVGAIDSEGKLLRDFGGDGEVHFMKLPDQELTNLVMEPMLQVDDYLYVAGSGGRELYPKFIYRLHRDGRIDENYNDGRPVFLEVGKAKVFHLVQDGDGILIGVWGVEATGGVIRYDAAGKRDLSFGQGGWLNMPVKYMDPVSLTIREYEGSRIVEVLGGRYLLRHRIE
ncbi:MULTISPECIES: hypothetical protein [unclassified Pseudomonas]|uniref:hypothetical protein n=1 Tax=Pseudomonas TaxID=286 RepID=UPI00117B68D6|nr:MULTISPECIES: hypothetical protein [unclassified Pseudomonas]